MLQFFRRSPRIILPGRESATLLGKMGIVNFAWTGFFSVWVVFLSGAFGDFVGAPGALQAMRLRSLLEHRHSVLSNLEEDIRLLEIEKKLLETDRTTQEREIRRILGYVAEDEMIFEFSNRSY